MLVQSFGVAPALLLTCFATFDMPMDKRLWRAACDELDELIAADSAALNAMHNEIETVKARLADRKRQLADLVGAPVAAASGVATESQPLKLNLKRARLAVVRDVGVQTD